RPSLRLAQQTPAALKQGPCDLEGDRGLAGAGGERQQDALASRGDGLKRVLDGVMLVVARIPFAAGFERNGGEAVAPCVRRLEYLGPEFFRRRIALDITFGAGLHVDPIDALAVGRISKARL